MAGDDNNGSDDLDAGEHFIVNAPLDDVGTVELPEGTVPPDIVDEPSEVIRAIQLEAASSTLPHVEVVTPSGHPAVQTNEPLTDIDLDAMDATPAIDEPVPVLEFFADGDISEVFDDEPTRPWLDPLPKSATPRPIGFDEVEDEQEDESTIMGGGYDPSVDRSQELVTIRHGKSLSKLKAQLAQYAADPNHNYAGINFNRLEENIRGIGKTSIIDRRFTVVRTRKNLFLVSNENLVDFQNRHHSLMGIDLTKSSLLLTTSGKTIHFTLVTGSDLEVMQKAGTGTGRISAVLADERQSQTEETDTLLLPEVTLLADGSKGVDAVSVDLAELKAKIARGTRDPGCIAYFDPAEFAKMIIFVMSFYDGDGKGYYFITTEEAGEEQSYQLYVEPKRPSNPDLSHASFIYGNEFCTLVPEE